jgi:hypothetical protein
MDAQALHGLRYGDYQRYRQYCSRRMRRLRQGTKFLHWEQGKGKSKFVQREIGEEQVVDVRFLAMVLNKAERAWAYAMQLRETPSGPGREVHHVMRLLAKAAKHAAALLALCQARADDRTCLEAEVRAPPPPPVFACCMVGRRREAAADPGMCVMAARAMETLSIESSLKPEPPCAAPRA